jgi:hypothetical protein
MSRSSRQRFVFQCGTPSATKAARRPPAKLSPGCEALDDRQLLSAVAPVATEFAIPSAALITNATSILEGAAPKAFAQLQTALVQAEQHAHINQTDVSALAQDEVVVDQDIESANISAYDVGNDLNVVQDWVDYAFTYGSIGFHVGRTHYPLSAISQRLYTVLGNVSTVFDSSGSGTSIAPVNQLIDQIKVVAKQAKVTPAIQAALDHSYSMLNNALGLSPNTMPGPGGTMRDPLVVYYDAQVNNFIK